MVKESAHDDAVRSRKHEKATGWGQADVKGSRALIPWVLGLILWVLIYVVYPGFLCSYGTWWLVIPFFLCLIFLFLGSISAFQNPQLPYPPEIKETQEKKSEYERESFRWISTYAGNVLLAITIVVPTAAYLVGIEIGSILTPEWWPFFVFEFLALGVAAGVILPFFWPYQLRWTVLLRHLKTVCFLYMSFFFLSGLIVLAQNVHNLINW